MNRLFTVVLFLFSLGLIVPAHSGVNVNNGNFFVAYTDFIANTGGIDIKFVRTYNSRSNYVKGYFGVGWSSKYEGYLRLQKRDIVYHEGGGGNAIVFKP